MLLEPDEGKRQCVSWRSSFGNSTRQCITFCAKRPHHRFKKLQQKQPILHVTCTSYCLHTESHIGHHSIYRFGEKGETVDRGHEAQGGQACSPLARAVVPGPPCSVLIGLPASEGGTCMPITYVREGTYRRSGSGPAYVRSPETRGASWCLLFVPYIHMHAVFQYRVGFQTSGNLFTQRSIKKISTTGERQERERLADVSSGSVMATGREGRRFEVKLWKRQLSE